MKLKINLEQEMTEEELDVLYEEFDIDGENKEEHNWGKYLLLQHCMIFLKVIQIRLKN